MVACRFVDSVDLILEVQLDLVGVVGDLQFQGVVFQEFINFRLRQLEGVLLAVELSHGNSEAEARES